MKLKVCKCSNGSVMLEFGCEHNKTKTIWEGGHIKYTYCRDCNLYQCPKCGEFSYHSSWMTNYLCEECSFAMQRLDKKEKGENCERNGNKNY
jgi:hypothetical protein